MLPYQEFLFLPANPIIESKDIDEEIGSIVAVEDFANQDVTGL